MLSTKFASLFTTIALAAALTGCSSVAKVETPAADGAGTTAEETAPEAAAEGTRDNPAAVGSTIEISDNAGPVFQVVIGEVTVNANDVVAKANQFNEAADEGFQYLVAPVTFTYVGDETGTPWLDVQIAFVSAAGTTHTSSDSFVSGPEPALTSLNEMYNGATEMGNVVLMVPSADVEAGTFTISALFGGEKYFVKVV